VPATELELAAAEEAPDFAVPEPPADDSQAEDTTVTAESESDDDEEDLEPAMAGAEDEEGRD